jgi:hypothetical protein
MLPGVVAGDSGHLREVLLTQCRGRSILSTRAWDKRGTGDEQHNGSVSEGDTEQTYTAGRPIRPPSLSNQNVHDASLVCLPIQTDGSARCEKIKRYGNGGM